jgi:uncharacterized Ntn-hydrolase superfamily protein
LEELSMTFSVVARCARTGRFGVAVASYTMAVGAYTDGAVRPNVGATMTQGHPLPRNNRLALDLLAQGYTPEQAMTALEANDPHHDYRQIALVDREGVGRAHTGASLPGFAGQRVGSGFAVTGNMLANEQVLDAIVSAFQSDVKADLEDRLLKALEAGRDAGSIKGRAGPLQERSVALVVWGKRDYSDIDLRIDLQDGAIAELRRIYVDFRPTMEYYEERARHPRNAIPAMEFADMLRNQQQKEAS